MSSHHFVKEGQEPALIILDFPGDEPTLALLEWAPLVIVSYNTLDATLRSGIKLDVIVCPVAHQQKVYDMTNHQHPLRIVSYFPGETILAACIRFMADQGVRTASIVCNNHVGIIQEIESLNPTTDLSIIDPQWKWSMIRTGRFRKWVGEGTHVRIRSQNEVFILSENARLERSDIIVDRDGPLMLESRGLLWVGERRE